jgi:hypothetical protein
LQMIHGKETCCMVGTSRNLDRELNVNRPSGTESIEQHYRALLQRGVDVIETDLPREVGKLLYNESTVPVSKSQFFHELHF